MVKLKYNIRKGTLKDDDLQDLWAQIKEAIEKPEFKWRTIKGLSEETGVPVGLIEAVIVENEDDIVQSRIPSKNGRELFTTREHYKEKNSIFYRLSETLK